MTYQAIAFDLDDTLLRDDKTISSHTLRVLRQAAEQGIHVIPASGRTSSSMRRLVDEIGCASCYISCNGAEVRTPSHELMMQELLPVDLAREVARFAHEHQVYAQTYIGAKFFHSMRGKYAEDYAALSSLTGEYVGDLEAFLTEPTPKMLLMDDPARIAELLAIARVKWAGRASLTCSAPYFLEVNPLKATKGNALKWCADHLGFSMDNLVAFGDSLNDLSMLEAAGTGVAVANARDDVKAQIPTHCLSNQEDGVADYIEKYVLREERP